VSQFQVEQEYASSVNATETRIRYGGLDHLTIPSFSKVAPVKLKKRKDLMVLRSYGCAAFKIKR